jgi:GT2 family glycosyltransferase
VVLNYNGGELTLRCLRSLRTVDWPPDRLEVVLVDNASTDGLVARVVEELPEVRVVRSPVNAGFAGGCNLGMRDLEGIDYVALVNSDATVDRGWLAPLVDALEADPDAGASCSKILFDGAFVELAVDAPTIRPGRGDGRALGVRVSGARVDGRDVSRRVQFVEGFWGPEPDEGGEAGFQWSAGHAVLRVPVPECGDRARGCELRLSAESDLAATVSSGQHHTDVEVGPRARWHPVRLGGERLDVVNNVGTELRADGHAADRGYLEPDRGQYDAPAEVFAWCGASVLLSTRYLQSVGRFDERLFLYYEDVDLSWKGQLRGWHHRYVPASVVRHVHSATIDEASATSHYYKERNRLLTLTRHAPAAIALRAVVSHVLVTASYARRDVVSPMLRGRRPRPEIVRRRLRAEGAFARLLPATLASRSRGRATSAARREVVRRWAVRG